MSETVFSTFLEEAFNEIAKTHSNYARIGIVLPSQRAGLFLKKHIADKLKTSVVLPQITTVYSFVERYSGLKLIDSTTALLELYQIYREIHPKAEEFAVFYKWGQLLLNDFNEIDNYLCIGSAVYQNLEEIKNIESDEPILSSFTEVLSERQISFNDFWKNLGPLYEAFKAYLLKNRLAYSGMQVRYLAEHIDIDTVRKEFDHIYFLGLNALNKAEERIVNQLGEAKLATVFWDVDDYYIKNGLQEAGRFFPKENNYNKYIKSDLLHSDLELLAISAQKSVGQTKVCAEILKQLPQDKIGKTAVILANEQLLLPMLNSIPQNVAHINLTMGLPLKDNSLFVLLDALFELNIAGQESVSVDLIKAIVHHHILYAEFESSGVVAWLERKNWVQINEVYQHLIDAEKLELAEFFKSWKGDTAGVFKQLTQFLSYLRDNGMSLNLSSVENEFLFETAKLVKRLQAIFERYSIQLEIGFLRRLFSDAMRKQSLTFLGEPLRGLQIMGMLETRALDFENLIIVGANEGIMPAAANDSSLIPNDLKRYFGLPTFEKREAIYAYYVYRLLQRSKKVCFIYNNIVDELGGSEKSRYLLQLSEELPSYNPTINFKSIDSVLSANDLGQHRISVAKTPAILAHIKNYFRDGVSPSALNTYLASPLDFYLTYVLGVSDDVNEEISAADRGTIFHAVLENFYKNCLGKVLSQEHIKAFKKEASTELAMLFKEHLPYNAMVGQTKLSFEILKVQLDEFFDMELQRVQDHANQNEFITILALEQKLSYASSFMFGGEEIPFLLKGTADRIERIGTNYTIIDYKTGKVEQLDVSITSHSVLLKKEKAMQLAMYGLMYSNTNKPDNMAELNSAIVSIGNLKQGLLCFSQGAGKMRMPINFNADDCADIEHLIASVLSEMLITEIPFMANEKAKYPKFAL